MCHAPTDGVVLRWNARGKAQDWEYRDVQGNVEERTGHVKWLLLGI